MAVVLCTGLDPALLETRKLILEQAGHTVVTAKNQDTIIAACYKWIFDVAVIGQSVSPTSKRSIGATIREHCPSAKILELYASNQPKAVEFANSWLEVPADVPQELADRVSELANPNRRSGSAHI